MLTELVTNLSCKKILILGFGIEGESTYNFLRKKFPTKKIGIADSKHKHEKLLKLSKTDTSIDLYLGEEYLKSIQYYDFVIKSPGIKSDLIPQLKHIEISCQADLFLNSFKKQIIGITGTKGKSTTSSLIHHLLNTAKRSNVLIGNIGVPPFDIIDQIETKTIIVYELSSHMLETVSHSPHISIVLNLFPEHLDHYKDFKAYKNAKANIYKFHRNQDFLICPEQLEFESDLIQSNLLQFDLVKGLNNICFLQNNEIILKGETIVSVSDLNLLGQHNLLNVMAAILACNNIGILTDDIKIGLKSFKGLEHRLEYVGLYDGIHYYNDSIATIPEAVIEALKAIPSVDTLILGGFDRGLNYDSLIQFISKSDVQNIVFLGEVGKRLLMEMKSVNKQMLFVKDLEASFSFIREQTTKGKACLLSPAASSYDQFENFEERGHLYKKLARNKVSC